MCAHDKTKYFVRIKIYLWNQKKNLFISLWIFVSRYGLILPRSLLFFSYLSSCIPSNWINKTWAKCTFNEFEPENACLLIRLLVKRLHFFHLFSPYFIRFRNGVCVCVRIFSPNFMHSNPNNGWRTLICTKSNNDGPVFLLLLFIAGWRWSLEFTRSTFTLACIFIEIYDICMNTKNVFSFYDSNNNVCRCLFNGDSKSAKAFTIFLL